MIKNRPLIFLVPIFLFFLNRKDDGAIARQIIEIAQLQILRAILERSTRRWEFVWHGITISAPVLDQSFYNDFFEHKITIAPGDSLEAKVKIYQKRDDDTGIYTNDKYEVIEVLKHLPRPRQTSIELNNSL